MKIVNPRRATHTYKQRLVAEPAAVVPLLCPVREADWIVGWDPLLVVSSSGLAEPDCVFTTKAEPLAAVWYVTRHEPVEFVEMIKIVGGHCLPADDSPARRPRRLRGRCRVLAHEPRAGRRYLHRRLHG